MTREETGVLSIMIGKNKESQRKREMGGKKRGNGGPLKHDGIECRVYIQEPRGVCFLVDVGSFLEMEQSS